MTWDRAWLVTWTCYGNWLPGDRRGFVAQFVDEAGNRVLHNRPGTEFARDLERLQHYCRQIQKFPTTRLTRDHAGAVVEQFRETATHRGWQLAATAVMSNHIHLVVLVPGDPEQAAGVVQERRLAEAQRPVRQARMVDAVRVQSEAT